MGEQKQRIFGPGFKMIDAGKGDGDGCQAYITLSGADAGKALQSLLVGNAPATFVEINDKVDYMSTKMIDNTHMMATFGHSLVQITISGLDIFSTLCPKSDGNKSKKKESGEKGGIQEFYNKYNLQSNPTARVDVSISYGGASTVYRSVLVTLKRSASSQEQPAGAVNVHGTYTIELLGVRKDKAKADK